MKIYRAGIYARLSVRGSERKAESIENQFLICREFANYRSLPLRRVL